MEEFCNFPKVGQPIRLEQGLNSNRMIPELEPLITRPGELENILQT